MSKLDTPKTSWDLTPLFKNDNDPEIEKESEKVEKLSSDFIDKWKDDDSYLSDPKVLRVALDEYEYFLRFHGAYYREIFYYHLKSILDQANTEIKAKLEKTIDKTKNVENDLQFFILNISKIEEKKQKVFLEYSELQKYKHFLEKAFKSAKYNLSEKEERIMNLKSATAFSNWVRMTEEFLSKEEIIVLDEDGKKRKKSFEEILSLISSKNKKVRDGASFAINTILEKHSDVAEHEINSVLKDKQINDELRGFERLDKSRHIVDDIDSDVVDALLESVKKRFGIAHKYYKLKAKMLGLKKLEYHERNVEYGNIDIEYDYDKSVNLVYISLKNLDDEFAEVFERFVKNGQIDVFPKKGKGGGAFCADFLPTLPTYILLNHNNKFRNVLTIAHEIGHGINSDFMKRSCHALDFDTPKSTAEVASTFMEDFVFQEILKDADENMRLVVMMQKLNDMINTIQRQVACYLFEKELHGKFRDKGYLSKKEIGKIFQKNMGTYMGESVEQSKGSENWWIYWSHIRSYFYVYSYASGLIISKSLQNMVKEDSEEIKKVKYFLSAGSSESPKNIFKNIGIDIANKDFWNRGLDEIEKLLCEAEQLAKKLNKI